MALCVAAACSSNDAMPLAPGAGPAAPQSSDDFSASPQPEPRATETNFTSLVCATDEHCAPVGYCVPYPTDAGEALAPDLAASSGPAGGEAFASGPADGPGAAADRADLPPGDGGGVPADELSADAGAWTPIGRCVLY